MKVTALVENQTNSDSEIKVKHGLSLYIETPEHRILFDVGPDNTLFENSVTLGIDLLSVPAFWNTARFQVPPAKSASCPLAKSCGGSSCARPFGLTPHLL